VFGDFYHVTCMASHNHFLLHEYAALSQQRRRYDALGVSHLSLVKLCDHVDTLLRWVIRDFISILEKLQTPLFS